MTATGGVLESFVIFRWFGLFAIAIVFSVQLVRNLASAKPFIYSFMGAPIIALIVIGAISAFFNKQGIMNLLGYLALYLQYPLFFIVLLNLGISEKMCKVFIALFLFLIFLQVPEVILRFLLMGITWDGVSMTLGAWGTYNIGVFSIYAVAFITSHAIVKGVRFSHFVLLGMLLLTAIIGEIKIVILACPFVVFVTLLARYDSRHMRRTYALSLIVISIIVAILLAVAYVLWERIYAGQNDLARFLDSVWRIFAQGEFDISRINRIGSVAMLLDFLNDTPLGLLLGLGPGTSLAGNFFDFQGKLLELMPESFMITQISATLADVGLLGFAVYFWMFILFFRLLLRVRRQELDTFNKIVVYGSFGVLLFYAVLGPVYNIVWRSDVSSFVFYFIMAYVYLLDRKWRGGKSLIYGAIRSNLVTPVTKEKEA